MNVANQKHTSGVDRKTSPVLHSLRNISTDFAAAREINFMISKLLLATFVSVSIALGISTSASASPALLWVVPVLPDSEGLTHLINPYRQPNSDYSAGHRGVDYRVEIGQAVVAASEGIIAFNGSVVNRQLVTIRHEGDLVSEYEPVCSLMPPATQVRTGDLIGEVCQPGETYSWHCLPSCLHFSLRRSGLYLSPLALIGGLSPSRLLAFGG